MSPKSKRRWLFRLAVAVRARIHKTIDVLADPAFSNKEAATFEKLVWETYQAIFGNEETLRWLLFLRALEKETHTFPTASSAVVARHVRDSYGEIFPDLARKLNRAKVTSAVEAWRKDRGHFEAARAALLSALPKTKVPTAHSMATKWSAATKNTAFMVPSKRRPGRRSKVKAARPVRSRKARDAKLKSTAGVDIDMVLDGDQ